MGGSGRVPRFIAEVALCDRDQRRGRAARHLSHIPLVRRVLAPQGRGRAGGTSENLWGAARCQRPCLGCLCAFVEAETVEKKKEPSVNATSQK